MRLNYKPVRGFIDQNNFLQIYFAGDTGYGKFFSEIYKRFGTFQLTDEGVDEPVEALRIALEKSKVSLDRFVAPKPGETHLIKK